jgi:hypothetical protein
LLEHRTWTRLNATAHAGSLELCFTQPVSWPPYSQIVIASTGFDMNEAEQRTTTSLTHGGHCVRFARPLAYEHLGERRVYGGQPVELRAEVGLLSRNVRAARSVHLYHNANRTICAARPRPCLIAHSSYMCELSRLTGSSSGSRFFGIWTGCHPGQ